MSPIGRQVIDNLRTRIAAVLESIRRQRDGDAAQMADAVIRELQLTVVGDGIIVGAIVGEQP